MIGARGWVIAAIAVAGVAVVSRRVDRLLLR